MSAAKLRKFGRGSAIVATTALVMTSFGPAAFAAWDDAPQTATVNEAATIEQAERQGTIGIADADAKTTDNQGAKLIQAGQNDQAIADTMITLPNRFKAGDVIELHLLDRQVSEEKDYKFNSGPSMAVGFSGTPKVTIDAAPKATDAQIDPDSDATTPMAAWAAPTGNTTVTKPGVAPAFSVSTASSNGGPGQNVLRLTVNSEASTGDPDGRWAVTLSDLKVNLGASVTPGALRLVPFSINADGNATEWFCGNARFSNNNTTTTADDTPREIGIYTVPAYVSPAKIASENTDIIADGTAQDIGALTITETQGYSLGDGTYTLNLQGAAIANTDPKTIKVAVANGGANEVATVTGIAADGKSVTLSLKGTDPAKVATYSITGVQLKSATANQIKWGLTGAPLAGFMSTAGTSPQVVDAQGTTLIRDDASFLSETGATPYNTVLDDATNTAGAELTQQEAGKFDTPAGADQIVAVDYTAAAPVYNVVDGTATGADGADTGVGDAAPASDPDATEIEAMGGAGTYTVTIADPVAEVVATGNTAGITLDSAEANLLGEGPATVTYQAIGANQFWTVTGASTVPYYSINGTDFYTQGTSPTGTTPGSVSGVRAFSSGTALDTQDGAFTVDVTTPQLWTLATPDGNLISYDGTTFGTDGNSDGDLGDTGEAVVTFGSALEAGSFTIANAGDAAEWTFTADVVGADGTVYPDVTYNSADGRAFTKASGEAAGAPATITFGAALAEDDGNFTVEENATEDSCGVWQKDILAPLNDLTVTGSSSAGVASIGGTNRFGTAARIASEYVKSTGRPTADTAIVVNGMAAPDALSASFLSQREGAPILLTAPGQLPTETVEALRDLGVRKVYIVGGKTAVGDKVFNALKEQNAYMWDDAAKAIKPRGDKLEVLQLGGDNRYETNWRVNTYAAAQTASNAPVGKIAVGAGQSLKTTTMIARSSNNKDFVDALSASVLSAGRVGGLKEQRGGGNTVAVTAGSFTFASDPALNKVGAGEYTLNNGNVVLDGQPVGTYTANVITINGVNFAVNGTALSGNTFTVTANPASTWAYDSTVSNVNALPTILTRPDQLVPEAKAQMKALHLEHALLIGSDDALSKSVNDQVAEQGLTSHRIEGKDRWETAANVNRFAMADQAVSDSNPIPGLGFDGNRVYSDDARTNVVGGSMTAYLANGMKFPDALVAGPWISRTRNAMVMTLQNDLPEPTAAFLSEKAEQITGTAGLGQGDAVSSAVIAEANKIVSSK
ncbi:cell wall-binding repeat-containing protein [Mobilicoccus pelagius]|uniref:Uncharacterized protein n=1 Tax=Mobilicoccus pelagius NBRC 104925 TaxID=1089455 RepID=H5UMZ9_9MICO|nr:cell wall-binding repeat-containing protein [Mobilicoccus pelagius]GAB47107.1 hypothetical protein MOPEL_003_01320 [Mobilicoccus pelagius NBRC 104925]